MPFPQVKSSPWGKKPKARPRFLPWSEEFWRRLCLMAKEARIVGDRDVIPANIIAEIGDMNERLYGKR